MRPEDASWAMLHIVVDDWDRASRDQRGDPDDQYLRRVQIRSVMTALEGLTNALQDQCLAFLNHPTRLGLYSPPEQLMLQGLRYELDENGGLRKRPVQGSVESRLAFVLRMYGRATYSSRTIDRSSDGWRALQTTIRVRNRLVHPRTISDMTVSDEELRVATRAFGWILANLVLDIAELGRRVLPGVELSELTYNPETGLIERRTVSDSHEGIEPSAPDTDD